VSDRDEIQWPVPKRAPITKIVDRETLASLADELRDAEARIVTTNGSYDLMHAGHAKALRWSSGLGDVLIVGVNSDASVRAYKGVNRPIIPQKERSYQVAALECVDYVCVFDEPEIGGPLLRSVRPHVHTTGSNWVGRVPEQDVIDELGVKIHFVPLFSDSEGKSWSTTDIVERIMASQ